MCLTKLFKLVRRQVNEITANCERYLCLCSAVLSKNQLGIFLCCVNHTFNFCDHWYSCSSAPESSFLEHGHNCMLLDVLYMKPCLEAIKLASYWTFRNHIFLILSLMLYIIHLAQLIRGVIMAAWDWAHQCYFPSWNKCPSFSDFDFSPRKVTSLNSLYIARDLNCLLSCDWITILPGYL